MGTWLKDDTPKPLKPDEPAKPDAVGTIPMFGDEPKRLPGIVDYHEWKQDVEPDKPTDIIEAYDYETEGFGGT